jgi:asparagine synthase (glutamine-hydrolysing)
MADTMTFRGPDDSATWADGPAGVALGFRRLAIMDLSPAGRQPMRSASGRYVIVFNGEVYNAGELRADLEPLGHRFQGHSDTEVMLAAVEQWGLEAAVRRFVGMFAFALWDARERRLALVRDRLGIKPLYYGRAGDTLVFASEPKALRAHPDFRAEVDRGALALFLRYSYVPAPYSIYRGVRQLTPGCILTVGADDAEYLPPIPFWSAREVAEEGVANPFAGTVAEAEERLDALLREAIKLRMIADVPLGAFLSGGIDSSTVVALMQAQSSQRVKTFSIGFRETAYDEAPHARAVAEHLGTDHTELYVTPEEARAVIPRLPEIYDEPFADSSQIPTFLVSRLTRERVTVSLSGDGGDELFGGYHRYFTANAIWGKVGWMPGWVRRGAGRGFRSVPAPVYDRWLGWLGPLTARFGRRGAVGDKVHKLAEVLETPAPETLYHRLVSHWKSPAELVIGGHEPPTVLTDPGRWPKFADFTRRMMYFDTVGYLPDDIFTKLDRASMAVSLEARVPLLDHRVVEFAWRLPLGMKVRGGRGKWLLRRVLDRYVPRELVERPKMGFGVPIDSWLRGPLCDWAEGLLGEGRLRREGFLDPAPIRARWAEHRAGLRNWSYYLWDVLMFQAWLERWGKGGSPAEAPSAARVLVGGACS